MKMAETMQAYVGTMQATFGQTFQRLNNSLRQSQDMIGSMNRMMEMLLIESLSIHVHFQSNKISARIRNMSMIPIDHLSWTSRVVQGHPSKDVCATSDRDDQLLRLDPQQTQSLAICTLDSGPDLPHPLSGSIQFSFPSPGTGHALEKQVPFSITSLEQLSFSSRRDEDPSRRMTNVAKMNLVLVSVNVLRKKILKLGPLAGVTLHPEGFYQAPISSTISLRLSLKSNSVDNIDVVSSFWASHEDHEDEQDMEHWLAQIQQDWLTLAAATQP